MNADSLFLYAGSAKVKNPRLFNKDIILLTCSMILSYKVVHNTFLECKKQLLHQTLSHILFCINKIKLVLRIQYNKQIRHSFVVATFW